MTPLRPTSLRYGWASAVLALVLLGANPAQAQTYLDPVSTSMGNSTLVSTGYRAIYTNPANLLIDSGPGKWQIGLAELGGLHNHAGVSFVGGRRSYIEESYKVFHLEIPQITSVERGRLLEQWFPSGRTRFDKVSNVSALLFGLSYTGESNAFGLAARARVFSTMSIGKGWYDLGTSQAAGSAEINRDLSQKAGSWLEFSFGMAQELHFFTGLTAENHRFILGLAPKLIAAGPHVELSYTGAFRTLESGRITGAHAYDIRSSGFFNEPIRDYFETRDSDFNIRTPDDTSPFGQITGYGFGSDFSLTYDIRMGRNSGYTGEGDRLRVSVAMTDLGFVTHGKDTYTRRVTVDTAVVSGAVPTNYEPTGRLGEWFYLIEQQDGSQLVFDRLATVGDSKITYSLPAAIHGGVSLRYGRLLAVVQASSGLNLQAGNTRQLRLSAGAEVRSLPWLPIRAGVLTDGFGNAEVTVGGGIDARYYELSVGARYRPPGEHHGWLPTAAGVAALQIRF